MSPRLVSVPLLLVSACLGLASPGCGSPQVAPDGPTGAAASGAPAAASTSGAPAGKQPLSHADSCQKTDDVFQLQTRSGTGSVSPMYGFGNPEGAQPTDEEALTHLEQVLKEYKETTAHLEPAVRAKSDAIADRLSAQRDLRKKRIEEAKKAEEESAKATAKALEEARKKGQDVSKIKRELALRDAAAFGLMGLVGGESEMGPLRDGYFDAYLAFFDECATDLGLSDKEQAAHRAIFPRRHAASDSPSP